MWTAACLSSRRCSVAVQVVPARNSSWCNKEDCRDLKTAAQQEGVFPDELRYSG